MANFKAVAQRVLSGWLSLLLGAVIAPIPVINLILAGYAMRCSSTMATTPYQLPPWRPFLPLFIDGAIGALMAVVGFIPVVIVTGLAALAKQPAVMVVPALCLAAFSYVLPFAIMVYARTRSLRFSWHALLTLDYLLAWLAGYAILGVCVGIAIWLSYFVSHTVVLPYILVCVSLSIGLIALCSLIGEAVRF
jgi:hypothetical protein